MLSAGNPYVLPSVVVAAVAYLALSVLTDLSVLIRVGVLVGVGIVVPVTLNRVRLLLLDDEEPDVDEDEIDADVDEDEIDADVDDAGIDTADADETDAREEPT